MAAKILIVEDDKNLLATLEYNLHKEGCSVVTAVDDREAARDFLTRIDDEIERLTQIVAEVTELSRIETGKAELRLEPVNLNPLVEEAITQLSPQAQSMGFGNN